MTQMLIKSFVAGAPNPIVYDTIPRLSQSVDDYQGYAVITFYRSWDGLTEAPYHSTVGYYPVGFDRVVDYVFHTDWVDPWFDPDTFVIKYEEVSGDVSRITFDGATGQAGIWHDPYLDNQFALPGDVNIVSSYTAVIDITVGVDDGTGNPVAGSTVTKRWTLTATTIA